MVKLPRGGSGGAWTRMMCLRFVLTRHAHTGALGHTHTHTQWIYIEGGAAGGSGLSPAARQQQHPEKQLDVYEAMETTLLGLQFYAMCVRAYC